MDVFDDAEVLTALAGKASAGVLPTVLKVLLSAAVAVVILGAEARRQDRAGLGRSGISFDSRFVMVPAVLRRYAWEAAGLAVCTFLVATLRSRLGLQAQPSHYGGVTMEQAWAVLTGWRTALVSSGGLLSVQALFRVAAYASMVLRGTADPREAKRPMARGVCVLLLAAQLCRMMVLVGSSAHPRGGAFSSCLEVACLLLLLGLGLRPALSRPLVFLTPCGLCVAFGALHRLDLAHNLLVDSLFSTVHALEFLAALANLAGTVWSSGGPVVASTSEVVVHLALPLQQGLAAYFYLEVFEVSSRSAEFGFPAELLWASSVGQLGMYLAASVLHFAECCDGDSTRPC